MRAFVEVLSFVAATVADVSLPPITCVDWWCRLKLHHPLSNKLQTFCVETMSKQPSKQDKREQSS
jgi:hypothetical protein